MIRRAVRRGLLLAVLAVVAVVVARAVRGRGGGPLAPLPVGEPWPARPGVPAVDLDIVTAPGPDHQPAGPSHPLALDEPAPGAAGPTWLPPVERSCPPSHPVKARLASRIFHLPGMLDYERTRPDRCYVDASAAETDGFRPARR